VKRWHRIKVDEFAGLLDAAPDLRWQVFYSLAYTSGARLGELFSLTWGDIDFDKGCVVISDRDATADMPPFQVKDHEAKAARVIGELLKGKKDVSCTYGRKSGQKGNAA